MKVYKLLFPTLLLVAGCGFQFRGSTTVLPESIRNIYIPQVENNSTEGQLTILLTESLRDRFDRYGTVHVVESEGLADAVLKVKVKEVRRETRSVTSNTDSELQEEIRITVSGDLRAVTGQALWANQNLSEVSTSGTSQQAVVTSSSTFATTGLSSADVAKLDTRELERGQEQYVMEDMSESIAKKIYEQAVLPEF